VRYGEPRAVIAATLAFKGGVSLGGLKRSTLPGHPSMPLARPFFGPRFPARTPRRAARIIGVPWRVGFSAFGAVCVQTQRHVPRCPRDQQGSRPRTNPAQAGRIGGCNRLPPKSITLGRKSPRAKRALGLPAAATISAWRAGSGVSNSPQPRHHPRFPTLPSDHGSFRGRQNAKWGRSRAAVYWGSIPGQGLQDQRGRRGTSRITIAHQQHPRAHYSASFGARA